MNDSDHPAYTETEVKFYVPDLAQIAARLSALGAVLVTPRVFEQNVRYENAAGTLSTNGIVLRLRQDNRVRLTYKEPLPGSLAPAEDVSHRFEAEVEVSDFAAIEVILGKLGYHPHLIYEKYRTTYMLESAEIVLDELPYGNFVEIEGDAAAIQRVMKALDLMAVRQSRANYVRLFEIIKRDLNLRFHDLTFANFEGITVPASAFEDDRATS
jgi:adenylate cyclase class 2